MDTLLDTFNRLAIKTPRKPRRLPDWNLVYTRTTLVEHNPENPEECTCGTFRKCAFLKLEQAFVNGNLAIIERLFYNEFSRTVSLSPEGKEFVLGLVHFLYTESSTIHDQVYILAEAINALPDSEFDTFNL